MYPLYDHGSKHYISPIIPVDGEDTWLAWTGLETKPVDPDSDEGVWDISKDKFAKLKFRNN